MSATTTANSARPTNPAPSALSTIRAYRRAVLRNELLQNIAASRPAAACPR